MSEIRVNQIKDQAGTGAPAYTYGIEIPVGVGITGAGGVNISGMVTATAGFDGNATGLTGTPNVIVGFATATEYRYTTGVGVTENITTSGIITAANFVNSLGVGITQNITTSGVITATTFKGNIEGTSGSFTGNVTVDGTLTYENLTNQDVLGLGTYRTGLNVGSSEGGGTGVGVTILSDGNAVFGKTGVVTATTFKGALTGNADTATSATTATTATTATNVTVADESTDTSCNVLFTTAATGNLPPKSGTNLTFDSADGKLSATQFIGVATGGTASGATVGVGTTSTILGVTDGATQNRFSGILVEKASIQDTNVANAAGTIDLAQGNIHYFTSNGSGATTADIIYKGGNNLSSYLRTGENVQVQIISKPNNSEYINAVTIDGGAVTEEWLGGEAPSSATASGYDVTTVTLIKIASTGTPNTDYLVLCAVSNYA